MRVRGLAQARAQLALGVEQHDVAVDRVLAGVGAQALFDARSQRGLGPLQVPGHAHVGGEEADVGRALEQVAHQHVDADLGAGAEVVDAVLQRLRHQALQKFVRQRGEVAACLRKVVARGGARGQGRQRGQQGELVPGAFDEAQLLALALDAGHVPQPVLGGSG